MVSSPSEWVLTPWLTSLVMIVASYPVGEMLRWQAYKIPEVSRIWSWVRGKSLDAGYCTSSKRKTWMTTQKRVLRYPLLTVTPCLWSKVEPLCIATISFIILTAGSVKEEADAVPDDVNKVSWYILWPLVTTACTGKAHGVTVPQFLHLHSGAGRTNLLSISWAV